MDKKLLDLIACPICKGELILVDTKQELICKFDSNAYPIRKGIPVLLENEARSITLEEKEQLK